MHLTFVQLGRYGDILNLIPLLELINTTGSQITVVTSERYGDIFDRVPFVKQERIKSLDLMAAIEHVKERPNVIISQVDRNPFTTKSIRDSGISYSQAQWVICSDQLKQYGLLDVDLAKLLTLQATAQLNLARNRENEVKLIRSYQPSVLLFNLVGFSSQLDSTQLRLLTKRLERLGGLDLSTVKAKNIVDLLGLYDLAKILVTTDTATLHLARASNVKVVALTRDDFWYATTPFKNWVGNYKYGIDPEVVKGKVVDLLA